MSMCKVLPMSLGVPFGQKKTRFFLSEKTGHKPGNNLLSHGIVAALPSAVEGLTGVFGMGTSVSPHLWKPE